MRSRACRWCLLVSVFVIVVVCGLAAAAPSARAGVRYAEVPIGSSGFLVEPIPALTRAHALSMSVGGVSPEIAVPIPSPDPFLAVSAVWTDQPDLVLSMRSTADRVVWSDWATLTVDGDSSTGSEAVATLSILPKDTRWVQFRFEAGTASAPALRVVFISPGASAPRAHESPRRPSIASVEKPPIVSRTDWGCPDGEDSPAWTPRYTTVTHLIVHHTVNSNTSTDWAAVVRAIFVLHKYTNGWGDIGYNYLVDPNGLIYEGRAGGDNVIGAHFSCANSNTMGVAFLGTFTSVLPTSAAWDSAAELLAWKADQEGIDPLASSYHPSTQLVLPNIAGHRDGNASTSPTACPKGTECPGDALYAMLPTLREDVAALIPPPGPAIVVTAPNGGEAWPVGLPHVITWSATGLDPSAEVRIFLSRDGGTTLDAEPIAVLDPGTTTYTWTPGTGDATVAAKLFVGSFVDGAYEASDWSDESFMIIKRRRTFRRP